MQGCALCSAESWTMFVVPFALHDCPGLISVNAGWVHWRLHLTESMQVECIDDSISVTHNYLPVQCTHAVYALLHVYALLQRVDYTQRTMHTRCLCTTTSSCKYTPLCSKSGQLFISVIESWCIQSVWQRAEDQKTKRYQQGLVGLVYLNSIYHDSIWGADQPVIL